MKRLFVLLLLVYSIGQVYSQSKGKTGHIDITALYSSMPDLKTANEEYMKFYKELDTNIKVMEASYQSKVKYFNDNANTLSDFIKQAKEKEIKDLQAQIQSFRQSAQDELTKKQASLLEPITKKAKQAIQDVAKEKGYKYIFNFNENNILYAESSDDIMQLVKQKLGIK
jgi:outer membrane protein